MGRLRALTTFLATCLLAAASTPAAATAVPIPEPPLPVGREIEVTAEGVHPAVAALDDRVLVAWATRAEPRRVVARLFDGVGAALGGPIDLGAYEDHPGIPGRVAAAAGGDTFVVAWTGPRPGAGVVGIYVRRVFRSGHPAAPAELVSGPGPRARFEPDVAADAAGRFAISWTTDRSPDSFFDVFARRFEADGSPDGSAFLVNEDLNNSQRAGRLAILRDGTLVAVWESFEGEARLSDVFMRSFGPGGVPLGREEIVQSDGDLSAGQTAPAVAALADGGYVVAWHGLFARIFSAAGAPRTDDLVLGPGEGGGSPPAVAGDPAGGFIVLWERECGPGCGGPDVVGRGVHADGTPAGDVFLVPVITPGPQTRPTLAAVPMPGGLFAAWETDPAAAGTPGIALRRVSLPCAPDERTLCLGGGRFRASLLKLDRHFPRVPAVPVPRGEDWGTFWFFRPENVEVAVKVLDGRALNGHFWVFYASLTNLDFALWVEDLVTGLLSRYENPLGTFASRGDTAALPAPLDAFTVGGSSAAAPLAVAAPAAAPASDPCLPTATRACLQGGRFAVEIEWEDPFGNRGTAGRGDLTADTAYFWFFREGNPEIVIKVLDGRPVNGRFWVFYGSLTNVAFTLTVTDTETGQASAYHNPLGNFASVGDTTAFPR